MPVLSPHRSNASALAGSYRSTFSSSAIDRPSYFSSASYSPRITSYSERFSSRSYTDSDGRRIYSRSGSITEDGVTTRFREESRENSVRRDSLSRDSGIGSIRENSVLGDYGSSRSGRESSIDGSSRISAINVLDSVAELRSKYSPANYVPACMRGKTSGSGDNISRSKSINDIGLPPIESKLSAGKKKQQVNSQVELNNYNNSVANSNNTNNLMMMDNNKISDGEEEDTDDDEVTEDDNGNRSASVADLRKKFDDRTYRPSRTAPLETALEGVRISDNLFKKQDNTKGGSGRSTANNRSERLSQLKSHRQQETSTPCHRQQQVAPLTDAAKLEVNNGTDGGLKNGTALGGQQQQEPDEDNCASTSSSAAAASSTSRSTSRINNFASYIPARDYQKGDVAEERSERATSSSAATAATIVENGTANNAVVNGGNNDEDDEDEASGKQLEVITGKKFNDITTTSPKLSVVSSSRSAVSPSPTGSSLVNSSSNSLNSAASTLASASINSNSLSRRSSERESTTSGTSSRYNNDNHHYHQQQQHHDSSPHYNNTTSSSDYGSRLSRNAPGASPPKVLGLNGLKNIGNTCFMNSVIQCLSNTKLLLEYLIRDAYTKDINTSISSMKGALIKSFAEVIKELWSEDASDRVVNTTSLKSQIQRFAPRFIGYAQQDAQEFLRYLLEGLHEDVNRVTEKPKPILTDVDEKLSDTEKSAESWSRYLRMDNSKIVDHFVGQLKSTLKCTHCGHCSVTFDPFWDLSLPIPQRAGQVRLSQCLDSFTREETLDGDEKPTCSKCKERRKCTKSFSIQKFPKILVIHLKRFSLAERFRGKLSVTVDFPLEGLDMSHYAADNITPCRYNLYAISNHSGTTYSGHYTAYCRHPYAKTWHEYNDSRVSPISSKSIVSGEAYVLFYEQEGQRSHL